MADSKKISIRLGIDGADGVKATLTAVGNDGSKALERISDAAQSIAPSLSSMTTAMREASRGFSSGGTNGFDGVAKSAAASARAMEAAFATEKRSMQAMLDAADPAAAALRRIAQAEAEANRALAHGTITQEQHETIMRSLAAGTETASRGYSRFGMIVQQAGFQLSDVAAVAASGGNVLSSVGVQLGQFVGFLGPWGAVAGVVVTVMGALAHVLMESGDAAADAQSKMDDYKKTLQDIATLEKEYRDAHRDAMGLLPINASLQNLKEQARAAEAPVATADKDLSFFGWAWSGIKQKFGYGRTLTDLEEKNAAANQAASDYAYGLNVNEGAEDDKVKAKLRELNEERDREIKLMQVASAQRDRAREMMDAEVKVREKLEKTTASQEQVEAEVAKARAQAASAYDQKQREEASQKQSEADDKATAAIEKQIAALKEHAYQLTLSDRELKIHQELLKGYENAGTKGLTPTQEQEITYWAGNDYDTDKAKKDAAKAEEDRMKAQREHMQEMRQFSNQMAASMTSAFEQAVFAGKDLRGVFSGLLDDMAKVILRATVMKPLMNWLVGGDENTGGGGFLGNIFGSVFHEGGVVGGAAPQRAVPVSAFAGAPRYHSGGIAGLSSDEVPAILQRGEVVLPRRAVQASGGSSVSITQNITLNLGGTGTSGKDNSALVQQITSQIATATKALVMQILIDQKRAGGVLA